MAEDNTDDLVSPVTSLKSDFAGSKPDKVSTGKPRSLSNGRRVLPCYRYSSNSSYNGGNARRLSTGKLDSPDSGQDVVPHYLRASTGSCHDFCKYGRKHDFEEKSRLLPVSKRKNKHPSDEQGPTWIMLGEAKKGTGTVVKQKPSTTVRAMLGEEKKVTGVQQKQSSSPGIMPGEAKRETVVKQKPSTTSGSTLGKAKKRTVVKQKPSALPDSMEEGKKVNTVDQKPSAPRDSILGDGKKLPVVEPSSPPGSTLGEGNEGAVVSQKPFSPPGSVLGDGDEASLVNQQPSAPQESMLGEENNVTVVEQKPSTPLDSMLGEGEKVTVVEQKLSTPPKIHSLEPSVIKKKKAPQPPKSVDSLKLNSSSDKIRNTEKKMKKVLANHSLPGQIKLKMMKSSSKTLGGVDGGGRKDSDVNPGKRIIGSKVSAQKTLKTPVVSPKSPSVKPLILRARNIKSLKLLAPLKDQNKMRRDGTNKLNPDKVPEKTLRAIKVAPGKNFLQPAEDGNIDPFIRSTSTSSPKSSSQSRSRSLSNGEKKKGSSADKYTSSSKKLLHTAEAESVGKIQKKTLKKGKAGVSDDYNPSVVKLKFRRGKVVDLQQETSSPRRLIFRWGRRIGEGQDSKGDARRRILKKNGVDGDNSSTISNTGKIVLRHQDVQEKKDAQVSLNNVIEETASKLVESKKSKVKALVGAFETVISLQDKPSTVTVT